MLYACVRRFDVMDSVQNFLELNRALGYTDWLTVLSSVGYLDKLAMMEEDLAHLSRSIRLLPT